MTSKAGITTWSRTYEVLKEVGLGEALDVLALGAVRLKVVISQGIKYLFNVFHKQNSLRQRLGMATRQRRERTSMSWMYPVRLSPPQNLTRHNLI